MPHRLVRLAPLALALAACAPGDQPLPFSADAGRPVERVVADTGATLSTPAGASIALPPGAVAGGTAVALATGPAAPHGGAAAVSQVTATFTPAGRRLARPAALQLALVPGAPADAWLASFVVVTPDSVHAAGEVAVDLNAGIVRGDVDVLGAVTAVVPAADQRVSVGALAALAAPSAASSAALGPVRTLGASCGWRREAGAWRWVPCAGLVAAVDEGLRAEFDGLAVVYPAQSGALAMTGDARVGATVSGALTAGGVFRARLKGSVGQRSPGSVAVRASFALRATPRSVARQYADRIVITALESSLYAGGETLRDVVDVVFPIAADGRSATVTFSRRVDLGDGLRGTASIAARLDLGY